MHENPLRAEHESLEGYLQSVLAPDQLERILFTNFNHWIFAQGALADSALTLNTMGSDVLLAFWASKTPMLDIAWSTSPAFASIFRAPSREHRIQRALIRGGIPESNLIGPPIRNGKPRGELLIPEVLTRTNIRKLRYRGADLGRAILQVHPTTETPLTDQFLWPRKWVTKAARSFAYVFDQTLEVIQKREVSAVAVYNGRFLHDRAAAAAAQSAGVPTLS